MIILWIVGAFGLAIDVQCLGRPRHVVRREHVNTDDQ